MNCLITNKYKLRAILNCITSLFLVIFCTIDSNSQSSFDRNTLNNDRYDINNLQIKTKSQWEYYFNDEGALRDSGYKAYEFKYDSAGRVTEYTKYHVYSDLTVKELYTYNKAGYIDNITRYNSANDVIETIAYKYNRAGKLSKELHTAYLNTVRLGVYFSILASVDDDSLFSKLQEDLVIEPKLEGYTITVNISDPDEENQYIVIGDESDPTSPRYPWTQLSLASQRGLLGWKGHNKKEHTYISKYIDRIICRYDMKNNLIEKEVYNTANDLIEKESFRYDVNNNRIAYYKYSEKGKLSSIETYAYDEKWRLSGTIASNPDGKVASRLTYKYDDYNNLLEQTWYNPAGDINGLYKFKYDLNNNLIEETKFRNENDQESRTVYTYDNNELLLEIIKYDARGKKDKLTKYAYGKYE
jgi:hypothetical protein